MLFKHCSPIRRLAEGCEIPNFKTSEFLRKGRKVRKNYHRGFQFWFRFRFKHLLPIPGQIQYRVSTEILNSPQLKMMEPSEKRLKSGCCRLNAINYYKWFQDSLGMSGAVGMQQWVLERETIWIPINGARTVYVCMYLLRILKWLHFFEWIMFVKLLQGMGYYCKCIILK